VRHAARGAVDAHGPVRVVAALDVQHAQPLAVLRAALHVPGHRVAAAMDGVVQDVQPCARTRPECAPCRQQLPAYALQTTSR